MGKFKPFMFWGTLASGILIIALFNIPAGWSDVMKVTAAISSTLTGLVLVAVGYDAELYKDATTIPDALFSKMGLVLLAIPALLGSIAVGVMTLILWLKSPKAMK